PRSAARAAAASPAANATAASTPGICSSGSPAETNQISSARLALRPGHVSSLLWGEDYSSNVIVLIPVIPVCAPTSESFHSFTTASGNSLAASLTWSAGTQRKLTAPSPNNLIDHGQREE